MQDWETENVPIRNMCPDINEKEELRRAVTGAGQRYVIHAELVGISRDYPRGPRGIDLEDRYLKRQGLIAL